MKLVSPNAHQDVAVSEADLKTLKLATPLVTAEGLARYLAFQRAYVEFLENNPDRAPATLAQAHAEAAQKSGAHIDEIGRIGALCTDYAGRRSVELRLQAKREKAQAAIAAARAAGQPASERDLDVDQKIAEQFASGSAYEQLAKRYGEEAVKILRGQEPDILGLHKRQTAVHV